MVNLSLDPIDQGASGERLQSGTENVSDDSASNPNSKLVFSPHKTIIDGDTQALTLACADLGSRNLLIESPHVCPVMAAAHERISGLSSNEADFLHTGLSEHPRN